MSRLRVRTLAYRALSVAGQAALDARLRPGLPAPAGRIDSISRCPPKGTRVVEGSEPRAPMGTPARTVRPEPEPVLARLEHEGPRHRGFFSAAIPGARLATPLGIVVSPDNRVLTETAWAEERLELSGIFSRRLPRPVRLPGTHATLISEWSENFFHWLLDALPRLAVLAETGFEEVPLIVPRRLNPFQRESLALLGIGDDRLTPFRRSHVAPDVLVWPTPAGHTGHPAAWACRWLRERLVPAAGGRDDRTRRLYVSRQGAVKRRVLNEDEVIAALARFDVEAIQAEELSLAEQIRQFAAASVVVAPHGAGLSNLMFSERARVVEILEPGYVNPCFYSLASALGHEYWYLLGTPANAGGDFNVPVADLVATMETALAQTTLTGVD